MIEATRRWFRRNRRGLAIGASVIGAGYMAGQYALTKISEARERMSGDRIAREKLVMPVLVFVPVAVPVPVLIRFKRTRRASSTQLSNKKTKNANQANALLLILQLTSPLRTEPNRLYLHGSGAAAHRDRWHCRRPARGTIDQGVAEKARGTACSDECWGGYRVGTELGIA